MMSEMGLIFKELISTYEGSVKRVKEYLKNVDKKGASDRVIEGRHTIWEIVNHLTFWTNAVIDAMNGEAIPQRKDDWPAAGGTESDWKGDQKKLIS